MILIGIFIGLVVITSLIELLLPQIAFLLNMITLLIICSFARVYITQTVKDVE